MFNPSEMLSQMWTTVQEPRSPAYVPNAYLLLLSAWENGWRVERAELVPSWDQHGLVYLATLRQGLPEYTQQLILPQNALIEELLAEMKVA